MSDYSNLIKNVLCNADGVFEDLFFYNTPIGRINLKDICNYFIFLEIQENKIFIHAFDKVEGNYDYSIPSIQPQYVRDGAEILARYIYDTNFYKASFRSQTYSLSKTFPFDLFWQEDTPINLYSFNDIPEKYYTLRRGSEHDFHNIRIISHLLYRRELDNYISKFETFKLGS